MTKASFGARGLRRWLVIGVLATAAVLSACGGESYVAGGGTSGTGISQGSVSGFSSVIVNGTRFEAGQATITVNGEPAAEADLRVGMVVTVRGRWTGDTGDGTAESIRYQDAARGPASAIQPAQARFEVLGLPVRVTGATVFAAETGALDGLAGLSSGERVVISGHFESDGTLRATRVVRVDALADVRLRAAVASVDAGAGLLTLAGGQVVDYTGVIGRPFERDELEDRLQPGTVIAVEGPVPQAGTLNATSLAFVAATVDAEAGDDLRLEGLITRAAGWADFAVAGQPVVTTADTRFEPAAASAMPPVIDLRVEVDGSVNANGALVADRVILRPEDEAAVEDRIATFVDRDAGLFRTRVGVLVQVTGRTVLEADDDDGSLSVGELRAGDVVEVDGRWDPTAGRLEASHLELEDDADGCRVKGPAREVVALAGTLEVLGVAVAVADAADLAGLEVGDRVEAEADEPGCTSTGLTQAELEVEDDDDDDSDDDDD